ncbi:hypothetical protein OOK58_01935 [Streptomyces sp. NBC_01728]|uniref:hypothetical protein n=1 Tax=unclassified Streptomyces TaxID=2593676 RepID=UPI0022522A2A|nr:MULTISPECIES: hypothetical protein [unclassified Streptomyces]MCX4461455.1 hypothetical protein [Streptomyces sp. NBC_01719]MCX4490362.1 hypothetical protein [Streptomyces sp. NBC_01728]MCX4597158.1 hypothetical protein [Streptomyces sp. NBC_01549]
MCTRCGAKFTDDRWEETTGRSSRWEAGDLTVCGSCRADDVTRDKAAAEAALVATAAAAAVEAESDRDDDQEPGRLRSLFRRRT